MTNLSLAQNILSELCLNGVREVVLCAGARNAPFVTVLSGKTPFKTYSFFEERSAAFFAIGRMLATGAPVAVVTTSGTAAAELLPATVEADYQSLPLVLVTADRPKSYRGSGAPQTIVQPGIFSHYVEKSWDFENEHSEIRWSRQRPVHINVCFDEPLIKGELKAWPSFGEEQSESSKNDSKDFESHGQKPLVILGSLNAKQSQVVLPIIRRWQRPVYVEGTAQLRGHPDLADIEVLAGETTFKSLDFDSLIRIGGVPTLRFWRDLEKSDLPVWHFTSQPFPGLARKSHLFSLEQLHHMTQSFTPFSLHELANDRERARKLEHLLARYPLSEPGWVRWISLQTGVNARVYLGNSMPIREWDLAAARPVNAEIFANRGVNGIDGQVSTFLGVADEQKQNWCVIGDLTALYDLSGPWALRQRPLNSANIVVINNGGGKIFERIFNNPMFENGHNLNFEHWAGMWNLEYLRLSETTKLPATRGPRVIEILPCPQQTKDFWKEWDQ